MLTRTVEKPLDTPHYRYLLCDLRTDQPITTLPLEGVKFGDRISRPGNFQASMDCVDDHTTRIAKLCQAYTGRAALWVYRDGALWWGGILWEAAVKWSGRGTVALDLSGATFDSYAHHRIIREPFEFPQWGQNRIVESLWTAMQATFIPPDISGSGDIMVWPQPAPEDGKLRDRYYDIYDAETYGNQIEELCDVIDGPEVIIRTYLDADGRRVKRLDSRDRVGATGPRFAFTSADLASFEEPVSALDSGTEFQCRGAQPEANAGIEQNPLMSAIASRHVLLRQGWPMLDVTEDHTDVRDRDVLNSYARGLEEMYGGAIKSWAYAFRLTGSNWTPTDLGTPVRLRFSDVWHDPPTDQVVRPVAYEIEPSDRQGLETVTFSFEDNEEGLDDSARGDA